MTRIWQRLLRKASALMWRLGGAEPEPVTVEVPEMVWRTTEEPDAVTFVVQEKKMRVCQCF